MLGFLIAVLIRLIVNRLEQKELEKIRAKKKNNEDSDTGLMKQSETVKSNKVTPMIQRQASAENKFIRVEKVDQPPTAEQTSKNQKKLSEQSGGDFEDQLLV